MAKFDRPKPEPIPVSILKTPMMVCVDGMDGSGKATVVKNLTRVIQDVYHRDVTVLDAPNYGSPTGRAIWDYLHEGSFDLRDRGALSLYFSVDRNEMLRIKFEKIFHLRDDDIAPPIVLANRWALSNLVYQTTLFWQTSMGEAVRGQRRMMDRIYPASAMLPVSPAALYEFKFDSNGGTNEDSTDSVTINLPTMWAIAFSSFQDAQELLHLANPTKVQMIKDICEVVAPYLRAVMTMEMCDLLYRAEIQPWWIDSPMGIPYWPFAHINYVELIGSPKLLTSNCAKRNNKGAGTDINETAHTQAAVLENIFYLSNICDRIEDAAEWESVVGFLGKYRQLSRDGISLYFRVGQLPHYKLSRITAHRAFDFVTVPVTTGNYDFNVGKMLYGWSPRAKMRSIGSICQDVWKASGLRDELGPIPSKFKFEL